MVLLKMFKGGKKADFLRQELMRKKKCLSKTSALGAGSRHMGPKRELEFKESIQRSSERVVEPFSHFW